MFIVVGDSAPPRYIVISDLSPRTLYVRRDVLNKGEIVKWARAQGFKDIVPDLHVTIAYSNKPVDWARAGDSYGMGQDDKGHLHITPGGMRIMETFGKAQVLAFVSSALSWRHEDIKTRCDASWDHPEYQPHITISYADDPPTSVTPYRGKIVLGPEIFEEVDNTWEDDWDPNQPRVPKGSPDGGQWASGSSDYWEKLSSNDIPIQAKIDAVKAKIAIIGIPQNLNEQAEANALAHKLADLKNQLGEEPDIEERSYDAINHELDRLREEEMNIGLDLEQEDAIADYTNESYDLNDQLRSMQPLSKGNKFIKENLDDIMAQSSLPKDMTVYRMVDPAWFDRWMQYPVGTSIRDMGFMSTSANPNHIATYGMEITVPKGTKAFPVGSLSEVPEENEVILDRGTTMIYEGHHIAKDPAGNERISYTGQPMHRLRMRVIHSPRFEDDYDPDQPRDKIGRWTHNLTGGEKFTDLLERIDNMRTEMGLELDEDELDASAVRAYTDDSDELNYALRTLKDTRTSDFYHQVKALDAIFDQAQLPQSARVYRRVDNQTLDEFMQAPVGSTIRDMAYVSTTANPGYVANHPTAPDYDPNKVSRILEIDLPKGTRAIPVGSLSTYPLEHEILLDRQTLFSKVGIVDSRDAKGNPTKRLRLRVIPSERLEDDYDPNQPRDLAGRWTAHNAAHLASLPPDMQEWHKGMGAVAQAHGYEEIGTAIVPGNLGYVHKMYRNTEGHRLHFYPRHDMGSWLWSFIARSGETELRQGGPEEVASFLNDPAQQEAMYRRYHRDDYDPSQPRVPAGHPGGGQWTEADTHAALAEIQEAYASHPAASIVHKEKIAELEAKYAEMMKSVHGGWTPTASDHDPYIQALKIEMEIRGLEDRLHGKAPGPEADDIIARLTELRTQHKDLTGKGAEYDPYYALEHLKLKEQAIYTKLNELSSLDPLAVKLNQELKEVDMMKMEIEQDLAPDDPNDYDEDPEHLPDDFSHIDPSKWPPVLTKADEQWPGVTNLSKTDFDVAQDWLNDNRKSLGLSPEEEDKLRYYTEGDSSGLNHWLRTGSDPYKTGTSKRRMEQLDAVFAKASMPEDLVVYRKAGTNTTKRWAELPVGTTFTDKGFISTAVRAQDISSEFGGIPVAIRVPRGFKAVPLGDVSSYATENELLLNRGTTFRVIRAGYGHVPMMLEVVPHKDPNEGRFD